MYRKRPCIYGVRYYLGFQGSTGVLERICIDVDVDVETGRHQTKGHDRLVRLVLLSSLSAHTRIRVSAYAAHARAKSSAEHNHSSGISLGCRHTM